MRKRRTRQHVIADLGINFVERQALLAGYVMSREIYDYGNDCYIHTFNDDGEIENGEIVVQVKSTDHISQTDKGFVLDISSRDLETWLENRTPTIIAYYDAVGDRAFFIELQHYFRENPDSLKNLRKFVRVYFDHRGLFDIEAVKRLRALKNTLYGNS
jgi:Domain of unknown function (DUF4365)